MKESYIARNLAFCFFFKELRIPQYRIAREIGITSSTMSRILSFKRPICDVEVDQFCAAYSIRKEFFCEYVNVFEAKQPALRRIKRAIGTRDVLTRAIFETVRSV